MRLSTDARIVAGQSRHALYLLKRFIAYPISDKERRIIEALSSSNAGGISKLALTLRLPKKEVAMRLSRLKSLGAIEPGRGDRTMDLQLSLTKPQPRPEVLYRVWIEPTLRCNNSCRHCYVSSCPGEKDTLSATEWRSCIDKIIDYGCEFMIFIGGEPLLEADMVGYLATHAKLTRPLLNVSIFSNLSVQPLEKKFMRILKDHDVGFGTTIHGYNARMHDAFTRNVGSFDTTCRNIRALRELEIDITANITRPRDYTSEEETRFDNLMSELGVDDYDYEVPKRMGRGCSLPEPTRGGSKPDVPPKKVFSSHSLNLGTSYNQCFYDHIAVDPSGFIMPCIMVRERTVNLREGSLDDYFASETYRRVSLLSKEKIEDCAVCEFRYACFDCRVDAYLANGCWQGKGLCDYNPRG